MKQLNRNIDLNEIRSFVDEGLQNGGKLYYVAIDFRNSNVVILNNKPKSEWYRPISKLRLTGLKYTKKNIYEKASEVRQSILRYDKANLICYSQAVSEYGKRNVIDEAFAKKVDNPHYKCAAPMRLYDANVIEYYMNMK